MSRSLKMSRKRLAFPIAVALAVLAICIPAANAKPQASTVTLSGIFTSEHQSSLAPLVANFERVYPNIHLNFTYIPNVTYQSVLLTDIQGGNMPDLVETQAGASSSYAVFALASQGKFADLTGSPWGKRVPPKYFKYIQVKRHTYAFPMGYSLAGLIYNVDLLHQLGLSLPTTFADLVAMCPKVSAAGKVTIASPWAVPTGPIDMMAAIEPNFVYNLDPNWTLERIQHKVTFASSPLWQRLLRVITQLRDANCYQPHPEATGTSAAQGMLANGQALFYVGATQEISQSKLLNPTANLAQAPFPADKASDTTAGYTTDSTLVAAAADSPNLASAKTFIAFAARPAQNELYAKVSSQLTGYDVIHGIVPSYLSAYVPFLKAGRVLLTPHTGWPRPDKGMFVPYLTFGQLPGLFTGQLTPDQILANMDTIWDKP